MREVNPAQTDSDAAAVTSHFVSADSLRSRLDWLNRLRWGAVVMVPGSVLVAGPWLQLELPVRGLLLTAVGLLCLNLVYVVRNRRVAPTDIRAELRLVKMQMVGDLVILTGLLNLTGGLENPFFFLYIVHVILASLLFKGREIYLIAVLAIVLFTGEVLGEYLGLLDHHHLPSAGTLGHELPFVLAGLGAFWLVMLICAYLGATIMKHNRAIKDDLVRRQEALIQANHDKMEYFRFVTHEVKSPVSTAQSAVQAALEVDGSGLTPAVRGLLERALSRLEQTNRVVRDLAELTRGGELGPMQTKELDLGVVVGRVVAQFSDLAAETGATVVCQGTDSPVPLRADPDMVEKVVANLLSNALRYGGQGRVTVALSQAPTGVTLAVTDQGIGIPRDDQERVFQEFFRTQRAREISQLGTGLGLSIVKRFVERMGGSISVRSEVGVGSTFTATWPRTAAYPGVRS